MLLVFCAAAPLVLVCCYNTSFVHACKEGETEGGREGETEGGREGETEGGSGINSIER